MAYIDITEPFSPSANRHIGNCLIILGVLLWVWLPYSYWQKREFVAGAEIAFGKIVQIDAAPIVTFRNRSGEAITAKLVGWRPKNLKKGDEIEVVFSSANPQQIELKADLWFGQWVIAISALVSVVVGWLTRKGLAVWGPLKQSSVRVGPKV